MASATKLVLFFALLLVASSVIDAQYYGYNGYGGGYGGYGMYNP